MSSEPQECKDPGCIKPATAAGWCSAHYQRQRRSSGTPCSVPDCTKSVQAGGLCSMHYQRLRDHGDVGAPTTQRIRGGRTAQQAYEAARAAAKPEQRIVGMTPCLIHEGTVDGVGYAQVTYGKKRVARLSRLALRYGAGLTFDSSQMASHLCEDATTGSHKRCIEVTHLYLGDALSNSRDAAAAGKSFAPHRPNQGRMTIAEKGMLVTMARRGATVSEIAKQLGYTSQSIRVRWRELCPDLPFPSR